MNPSEKRLDRKTRAFFDVLLIWQYHNQGKFLPWDQLRAREPKLIDKLQGDGTSGSNKNQRGIKYEYYYGGAYKIEADYFKRNKSAILERARRVYGMDLTETSEGVRLENLDQILKELADKKSLEYLKSIINADPGDYVTYTPLIDEPREKSQNPSQNKPIKYAWLLDPKDKRINAALPVESEIALYDPTKGKRRGPRKCVCGAPIPMNRTLCPACINIYGKNRKIWPKWLRDWAYYTDYEIDNESEHRKNITYIEGRNYSKITGDKTAPKLNAKETDRDDLDEYRDAAPGSLNENQLYNELSASDKALIYPGEYPNAAAGRSKYDKKELDQYSPQEQSAKIWAMQESTKASANAQDANDIDDLDDIEAAIDLNAAITALSERERLIYRRHNEGYTQAETAAALGINQQMVSKIFNRVVKKLKIDSN